MKQILYFSIALLALGSCQKDIEIDLNDSNAQLVIEANYSAEDSTVRVRITQTSNYFATEASPEINDATVTITDQFGNSTAVPFAGSGNYILTNYIPQYNTTYTLNVIQNGISYSAQCAMKSVVPLEDLTYQSFPPIFGNNGGYGVFVNFYDPEDTVNFYQIIVTANGTEMNRLNQMFTQDDELTDGNLVSRPLFDDSLYNINDVVGMELRSVDKKIYDYINEAASIVGGSNSAAPGNPTSNWDNGALGYFSAYSSSRKQVVIL